MPVYEQCRLEEARSEILRAADVYEKLEAEEDLEGCMGRPVIPDGSTDSSKATLINIPHSERATESKSNYIVYPLLFPRTL